MWFFGDKQPTSSENMAKRIQVRPPRLSPATRDCMVLAADGAAAVLCLWCKVCYCTTSRNTNTTWPSITSVGTICTTGIGSHLQKCCTDVQYERQQKKPKLQPINMLAAYNDSGDRSHVGVHCVSFTRPLLQRKLQSQADSAAAGPSLWGEAWQYTAPCTPQP